MKLIKIHCFERKNCVQVQYPAYFWLGLVQESIFCVIVQDWLVLQFQWPCIGPALPHSGSLSGLATCVGHSSHRRYPARPDSIRSIGCSTPLEPGNSRAVTTAGSCLSESTVTSP